MEISDIIKKVKELIKKGELPNVNLKVNKMEGKKVNMTLTLNTGSQRKERKTEVSVYMEDKTEKTDKEEDVTSFQELVDGYLEYIYEKYARDHKKRGEMGVYTTRDMSNILVNDLPYERGYYYTNKTTVRGIKNVRMKKEKETPKEVKEYMEKYTIRTGNSKEDRISVTELQRKYNKQDTIEEELSMESFKEKIRNEGYRIKAAVEKPYEYKKNELGEAKRVKIKQHKEEGAIQCVMEVKWNHEKLKELEENTKF